MKKIICQLLLIWVLLQPAIAQNLIIKGRVRCNQAAQSTKGAENIIVVPGFIPSRSAITVTSPSGYFEFNTGMSVTTLQDKQVNIYLVSQCGQCKNIARRIFISEDQDRQNRDNSKSYVTIKKWMLDKNCSDVELSQFRADSLLNVIKTQPDEKLAQLTNATAVAGTPALLNLLTTLASAGTYAAGGSFQAIELLPGKISYGEFLQASPVAHSNNMGFNFSPSREMSEAPFWNPSAMSFATRTRNVSLLTNVKNNAKLAGFFDVNKKLSLGAGGIYVQQDEFRNVVFANSFDLSDVLDPPIDSTVRKLKEYAVFASGAYKVNPKFSVGLTVKSIWQNFDIPDSLQLVPDTRGEFFDSTVKRQEFDADISLTYRINKSFQIGFNAMNLAGTKLYADAFVPNQQNVPMRNQRSFGLGLCYKWQRFNFGADVLFTDDDFYDLALGVNYVPFNDVLVAAGIAIEQMSYSVSVRLKHFRLAYINDNDWLVNEKRQGKSGILNGRLYGGFSFSF